MTPAKRDQLLDQLEAQGFDRSRASTSGGVRVGCSQCEATGINGVACHETGCPNQVYECKGCGNLVDRAGQYCEECS